MSLQHTPSWFHSPNGGEQLVELLDQIASQATYNKDFFGAEIGKEAW
ncbi:hypothetical protein [Sphaerochaeta globosa]|nr:hypothetical protein [Sphaerochaeta globosa]